MKAAKGDLKAAPFIFNLLRSPEYADTDIIDQDALAAEAQAMFENMMRHFGGSDGSDPAEPIDSITDESTSLQSGDGLDPLGTPEPVPEVSAQPELS